VVFQNSIRPIPRGFAKTGRSQTPRSPVRLDPWTHRYITTGPTTDLRTIPARGGRPEFASLPLPIVGGEEGGGVASRLGTDRDTGGLARSASAPALLLPERELRFGPRRTEVIAAAGRRSPRVPDFARWLFEDVAARQAGDGEVVTNHGTRSATRAGHGPSQSRTGALGPEPNTQISAPSECPRRPRAFRNR